MRRATGDFLADRQNEIEPNLHFVIEPAAPGNEFTAILVPEGSGVRLGLDRDGDGVFDGTELEHGSNPTDPRSRPERILSMTREGPEVRLRWESTPGIRYTVEWAARLSLTNGDLGKWSVLSPAFKAFTNVSAYTDAPPALELRRFYRIRRD